MWWKKHFILSFLLGSLYFLFSEDFIGGIIVFLSGSLIDIDHYILYKIVSKESFSNIYKRFYKIEKGKIPDKDVHKYVLPFHNFEFAIIIIILIFFHPIFLPIAIGSVSHFLSDIITVRNFKIKNYYSLIYYFSKKLSK
ncbi:MAG: hypothetical protein ACE5J4_00280 [Candidatus Aenigmatarchaeota archaeon]